MSELPKETINALIDGVRRPCTVEWLEETFRDKAEAIILEGRKFEALYGIKIEYGRLLVQFMGNPTENERDTWERQRDWAFRHGQGDASATALLEGLLTLEEKASLGDKAVDMIAEKIKEKSARGEKLISLAGRVRRTAEKEVEAAKTEEEVRSAIDAARVSVATVISSLPDQLS